MHMILTVGRDPIILKWTNHEDQVNPTNHILIGAIIGACRDCGPDEETETKKLRPLFSNEHVLNAGDVTWSVTCPKSIIKLRCICVSFV